MKRKIMSLLLSMAMILSFVAPSYADSNSDNKLDELDVMIISNYYLNANDMLSARENEKLSLNVEKIVPLYDLDSNVIAYYISYKESYYAVVNNNIKNPTLIEFGEGNNKLIDDILNQNEKAKIVYNNPLDVIEYGEAKKLQNANQTRNGKELADIYDYYPDLKQENVNLYNQYSDLKSTILSNQAIQLRGSGGYGFIDWDDMPSGSYKSDTIKKAWAVDWVTTGEFSDIANNHCGATAATNIALYYAKRGYSNLKKNNSNYDTFVAVHNIIGDGPVMMIAGDTKEYFSDRGYNLKHSSVYTFSGIKSAVKDDNIIGILLANGIVDWHWILGVGYREYTTGDKYIRIVNGWDDTSYKFYKPHSGSAWWSATEYWVK